MGIALGNIGILLLGLATWRAQRWFGACSILLSAIGLFGFFIAPSLGIPTGAAERLAGYPIVIWTITLGVLLLWRAAQERRRIVALDAHAVP
jgi:hypothetical protein